MDIRVPGLLIPFLNVVMESTPGPFVAQKKLKKSKLKIKFLIDK